MESIQREIFDRVADGSLSPEDAEAQQMMLLGEAQRLAYDKTGRIVLPEARKAAMQDRVKSTPLVMGIVRP